MKNKLFLGISAGFFSAVVIVILIFLLRLGGVDVRLITAISEIFIKEQMVGTFLGNVIGLIAHLICGSILGLGVLTALNITGHTRPVIKGALLGGAIWFLLCGILARILNISMPGDFNGTLFNLIIHVIYGIITSWIIVHFGSKVKMNNN